jgi:alginate O-acetyltransferase complex protein AlgI
VLWGAWHGTGLIVNHWWENHRPRRFRLPGWIGWLATLLLVLYGWLLFRAESLDQVLRLTAALGEPSLPRWWLACVRNFMVLASPLVLIEFCQGRVGNLDSPLWLSRWPRALLQGALLLAIIAFWKPEAAPFIYFQF